MGSNLIAIAKLVKHKVFFEEESYTICNNIKKKYSIIYYKNGLWSLIISSLCL